MEWYHELRGAILGEGWTSTEHNECLYFRKSEDGRITILTTYVDDTATTGDFTEEIQRMRASLLEKYEGLDLGTPDKLIRMGITLYVESIVMAGMGSTEVRNTSTPLHPRLDLSDRHDNEEELNPTIYLYASILGHLMFLACMIHPHLANSVRELGHREVSPCMRHWRGLQHVLRYIAGILDI
ncbi:unnamed protein product, partial [Choristocarpus tenellus]